MTDQSTQAPPELDEATKRRIEALRTGMVLALWAENKPDEPAIISDAGDRTFAQLNARANQLVRALRRRGLTEGDSVALICSNRPEFPETVAACQRSGLRFTPVNWHLTGEEAGYIVDDCEAKALIVDVRYAATGTEAAAAAPNATIKLAVGGDIEGFDSYDAALAEEDGSDIDDPALGTSMLYTSGTTGRPKGVHRPAARGAAAAAAQQQTASQRTSAAAAASNQGGRSMHLCTGPLYHAAPLAFSLSAPLAQGMGIALMDKWDAEETLRLIDEHKITHSHMVPTMFHRILSLPDDVKNKYDVSSLRYIIHGAAPCPVPVKKAIIDWWGPIVVEYYAATEGSGSFVTSEEWLKKPGTVGKPATDDHVRILDDDGNELAAGGIGTVFLKAPDQGRFSYYKDDTKTSSAYRDNYFTLGDIGYLDEEGYLYLTDRSANLIISGGVNIYPAEVEAVLLTHPAVGDAAVIGVPNEDWGEEVKAVIETQPDVEATPELAAELMAFCKERLASYKAPRSVDFTDELPRHDNGKLYKRVLRDQYRAAYEAQTQKKG